MGHLGGALDLGLIGDTGYGLRHLSKQISNLTKYKSKAPPMF